MDFKSVVEELKKTADDLLAKTNLDEKAVAKFNDLKGQAEAYLAKTDVDDQLKEKVNGILEKTDLDEKLKAKSQELLDKTDIDTDNIRIAPDFEGKIDLNKWIKY